MEHEPHLPWATHSMRFIGKSEEILVECYKHALINCPGDLEFAIRKVGVGVEWYAPICPEVSK